MKNILIVAAMDVEQKYILELLQNKKEHMLSNYSTLTEGMLNDYFVSVVLSGIGKVNAGISTALAIEKLSPDVVINIGVSGGLREHQEQGDLVVASSVAYHDVDVRHFGYKLGQIPNLPDIFLPDKNLVDKLFLTAQKLQLPISLGPVISGDQFIGSQESLDYLNHHFPQAQTVEMEAAAIAQSAYLAKVPFVIVRSISDKANGEAKWSYEEFLELAAKNASQLILEFLNN